MRKSYRKTYGYIEKYYPMKKVSIHAGCKKLSKSRKLWGDKLSLKRKNTRCPRSSVATPPGALAKADLSSTPRKSREGDVAGVLAEVAGSGSGHVGRGSVRATAGRGLLRSA